MNSRILFSQKSALFVSVSALLGLLAFWLLRPPDPSHWSAVDAVLLQSLSISSLKPLPSSHSNAVADDPRAAEFGRRLFFDPRLSANAAIACASCHQPQRRFADGIAKGQALGMSKRNTPSIVGAAYSPWLYWDGRKDSLWSQALSPLEDPDEHGYNRMRLARLISVDMELGRAYSELFGLPPDMSDAQRFPPDATPVGGQQWSIAWRAMTPSDQRIVDTVFANVGKAIAAYLRLIKPGPGRFDQYVQAVVDSDFRVRQPMLDDDEIKGLRLFIGKANCTQCHNGSLLTNHEFHNTGTISFPGEVPDKGRIEGVEQVMGDPFNCQGQFSDDSEKDCAELRFARTGIELIGAFRTPSLRNLEGTAPYMHKGQLATLADVLRHYNRAPPAMIGHNETLPLKLSRRELRQLEKFLHALAGPVIAPTVDAGRL